VAAPIRFGEFDLDIERYELRRAGHALKLERIPMELLILLLESDGKLVRRDAINRHLWGEHAQQDTDHSVNTAINKLRYILRDDPRDPRFIQTVVGQGYRFIAKVAAHPVTVAPEAVAVQHSVHSSPTAVVESPPPASPPLPAPAEVVTPAPASPQLTSRRLIPISIGGLLAAAVIWFLVHLWSRPSRPAEVVTGFRSIAVLPFANLAQNADQDYIVDGMTDQLITNLASSTPLRVISRSSAMHYKGTQVPMAEIVRDLHVDAVLEGSFLHTGKQVRVTANLIDARTDRHLWAQVYEESGDDLLSMQEPITNDIVRQVASALSTDLSTLKMRPVNVSAREAYLRGRFLWNKRTPDSVAKSIAYYEDAIRADPAYAEAYAALGDAYVLLNDYGATGSSVSLDKAQQAAERALALGGGLAEAHTVLGAIKTERDWDWAGAGEEYRRAIALNPSYPTARHWYSLHLARLGKMDDAELEIQRAQALDPLSIVIATDAAETAYWARKPREAMARIDQVLTLDPYFAEAHQVKGKIYEQEGQYEQALAELKIALALSGGLVHIEAMQAHTLALAGASDQALEIAKQLEDRSARTYISGVDIAAIYCGLGQTGAAMHWLDRAYQNRDKGIEMLALDPVFDGCHNDKRFQDLLVKLKLRPAT
jgi:TolB-like protein/DNA-binding winged helix-turn-helix (wHTH) protein/tetratricopeptide (TPR) repeat protein